MKGKRWKLFLVILLFAGYWAGCGGSPASNSGDSANAPSAAVVKVTRRDLTSNLEIASEFQPFQEIQVYAKVSGYIQKLYVDWGTHVKQGQLMAVLEIPELQQQLQQDEAAVRRSEQNAESSREELKRAESVYNVAHLTYMRYADVLKTRPDLLAQQDVDVAQGKDVEASAGVSSAKDAVAAAEQGVLAAKAALNKDNAMFAYARITAPFDGVVTEMYAYTGALLPAGTSSGKDTLALCRLSQNNLLRLVIPLPERAVSDVHIGESVAVRVTNPNKEFQGKIVQFSDQVDTQTRTMHAEVHVPNPTGELVPGIYASVLIPLHTVQRVLTLPIQIVQSAKNNQASVLVVNSSNHIEQRTVTLGLQTSTQAEIVSGLQENELVVFGDPGQYQLGELVTPKLTELPGKE
ncbi:MAG TPA: efflux RND transporter periplasmic adaptor subunit [Candidatus Acidoferrum sp.]|nr:efflux RND transporter periplasmic adaptor subunit [Candidatus Acidoferrum sp.]